MQFRLKICGVFTILNLLPLKHHHSHFFNKKVEGRGMFFSVTIGLLPRRIAPMKLKNVFMMLILGYVWLSKGEKSPCRASQS